MGINRFSALNLEAVATEMEAMAMETIKIMIQPYIKMELTDVKTGTKEVKFEDENTVKELLDVLRLQVTEDPIEKKFLVLLD